MVITSRKKQQRKQMTRSKSPQAGRGAGRSGSRIRRNQATTTTSTTDSESTSAKKDHLVKDVVVAAAAAEKAQGQQIQEQKRPLEAKGKIVSNRNKTNAMKKAKQISPAKPAVSPTSSKLQATTMNTEEHNSKRLGKEKSTNMDERHNLSKETKNQQSKRSSSKDMLIVSTKKNTEEIESSSSSEDEDESLDANQKDTKRDSDSESESDSDNDESRPANKAVGPRGGMSKPSTIYQKDPATMSSDEQNNVDDDSTSASDDSSESEHDAQNIQSKGVDTTLSDNDDNDDDVSDEDNHGEDDNNEMLVAPAGFTDDNAKWLKPKTTSGADAVSKPKNQLLSSDEDSDDGDDDDNKIVQKDGDDDDDEVEDDQNDEMLEIEKESKKLDEELQAEEEEAEEELQRTVRDHTAVYHLPTKEELEHDADRVVPPSEIRSHIESILEVLAEFKARREPGRARKEYLDQLCHFIAELHGFLPELVEYFLTMFSPAECLEFVSASDKPRPLVVRTNTLKTRRKDLAAALMKRGVSLDPLASWSKVGLKIIESPVPIGATPEYLTGMYMLQSAASMCPVLALAPEPKERVLDMAAAPGGKTSYLAQLMRNTGFIFANDLKKERQKATVANLHRLGVRNVIACVHDGRKLGTMFHSRFDRVLLDAPCSGLGVISRDPSVKVQRTMADVYQCAHLQKELLLSAIDALKYKNTSGGVMVYSTCSVSVAENEEVVQYALSKRDIKIIDTGLDFGKPGYTRFQQRRFHPSMSLTRRFYPHVHNMDGFFVAKIQKLSDRRPEDTLDPADVVKTSKEEKNDSKKSVSTRGNAEGKHTHTKSKHKGKQNQNTKLESDGNGIARTAEMDTDQSTTTTTVPATRKRKEMSIPPTGHNMKKTKKANAKVTKPRRMKSAGLASSKGQDA